MLKNNLYKFLLVVIIIAHGFLLTKLIFFPYPELFIYPYLTNHGLKPYSQILDQHFPGLLFLPINFDNLGLNNEVSARIWLIAVVLTTHLLLFFISKKLFKSEKKALVVNLLYLIWQPFFEGWVFWLDNFLPLLLLPAFYFLHNKKFLFTGIFIGLAIVFKQTICPLSFLVLVYIFWSEKNFRKVRQYLLGLLLFPLLMMGYLWKVGVLADFFYWTVIFNLTAYAKSGTQIPNSFGFVTRILVIYGVSLSGLLHKEKRLKIILFLFLFGSLAGAFDRANFVHFQPSLPFVVLGTTLGFYSFGKKTTAFILTSIYLIITIWWQIIFYKGHISGKVFFFDQTTYAIANKIKEYTNHGDKIFVFGAAPHLYQMTHTLPAGDIFVFQFPWFLKIAESRILYGIMTDKPNIVVSDRSVMIEDQPINDFAKEIDQYIQKNYKKIDQVENTEILLRKD